MKALADLVACVPTAEVDGLRSSLEEEGYAVLHLEGSGVVDKPSFLSVAARDLPGEGSLRPHNWDAFRDVARRGIAGSGSEKLVVLWTSADRMEQGGLQDFLVAVQIFTDLLRGCYEDRPEGRFHLVLGGDTANFQR